MKKIEIKWDERYSKTMDNDDMGRWARVAYAGRFTKAFINGIPSVFEIAWVKKLVYDGHLSFVIEPKFPYTGKYSFESLELAKAEVEKRFRFFVNNCVS